MALQESNFHWSLDGMTRVTTSVEDTKRLGANSFNILCMAWWHQCSYKLFQEWNKYVIILGKLWAQCKNVVFCEEVKMTQNKRYYYQVHTPVSNLLELPGMGPYINMKSANTILNTKIKSFTSQESFYSFLVQNEHF